jgi:hypothetical protein
MGDKFAENLAKVSDHYLGITGTTDERIDKCRKKFKKIKKIEVILDLVRGEAIPPASLVTTQIFDWYKPQSNHEYWPTFFQFLSDKKRGGFPKAAWNSVNETSTKILNRIPSPSQSDDFDCCGIVMGHVQSGKTANFTAVTAKAADCGYNLIVVLSGGNFNDLRNQTQSRLSQQLTGQLSNPDGKHVDGNLYKNPWHEGTSFGDTNDVGDVGQHGWDPDWDSSDGPCLVITKKNVNSLKKMFDWANSLDREKINLLLIDDEADHASINTETEKEGTRINKSLRRLLHLFPRRVYIGYTATPFANMFVHPDYDDVRAVDEDDLHYSSSEKLKTLYPRDFIVALPKPAGYLGLSELFGHESDWEPRTVEVDEKEAEFIRKLTDKDSKSADLKEGIEKSLMDFILTWGLRIVRDGNSNFHHTMLVHTKETKATMHPLVFRIENRLKRWTRAIRAGKYAMSKEKEIQKRIGEHYQTEFVDKWNYKDSCPDYETVIQAFLDTSEERQDSWPDVLEVSSDEEIGGDLNYHQYPHGRVVVAVGGNRLSRGFTLEGLTVSYFIRHPKQMKSDTLLQQGRWFGHRHGYKDLARIHLTEGLRSHCHSLLLVEEYLRDELEKLESEGGTPRNYAIPVLKALDMIPTAMNKIPRKSEVRSINFSGEIYPKSGRFAFHKPHILKENLKHTANLLNSLQTKPELIKGRRLWKRVISLEDALSYIENLSFPGNPFKLQDLKDYSNRRIDAGKGEISTWSVALVGRSRGQQSIPLSSFGFDAPLVMSERSRSAPGSDSIGIIHGPADFRLDLPGPDSRYRPNGRWSNKLLTRARDPENPLMVIYLFDSNAGDPPLFEQGQEKVPLVGVSVIFPHADIPPEEKELERTFWKNNFIED